MAEEQKPDQKNPDKAIPQQTQKVEPQIFNPKDKAEPRTILAIPEIRGESETSE
jgi:hypothetical protein